MAVFHPFVSVSTKTLNTIGFKERYFAEIIFVIMLNILLMLENGYID